MIIDELGIKLEGLVGIWKEDEAIKIGEVRRVPKSDDPKTPCFFGNFDRGGERAERALRVYGCEPGVETYYRNNDQKGVYLDAEFCAGPRSFLEKYLELGGDPKKLREDYMALFEEKFPLK